MPLPIEDYAIIADAQTAALVGKNGSIDWLCMPRFDSGACFAALLGDESHGHWQISPSGPYRVRRRYRDDTLVLETEFITDTGTVRLIDCMPPTESLPNVVRVVEGVEGSVELTTELIIRFDYGWIVPWVRTVEGVLHAVGGPDALELRTPVKLHGKDMTTCGRFTVAAGQRVPFALSWHRSHQPAPPKVDPYEAITEAERWWRTWAAQCAYKGPWREAVMRSLLTLKALTFAPTGGIVAAATTSLPEEIGGVRNWDYRFCWLRDATFTLYSLMLSGYTQEARAWRDWVLRAIAGDPKQLQIMYGVAGERRLPEHVLPLPGYEGSAPVRVGNDAVAQLQLDVYGELMDAFHFVRRSGLPRDDVAWRIQHKMLEFLETGWQQPDEGLWEVRGPRRHFTHSKVMSWVAFDRAVKAVERFGADGPVDRWRAHRENIRAEILLRGFNAQKQAFTQSYDSSALDASLLLIPLVGFLPAQDPRVASTVRAVERELMRDGLLLRYRTEEAADGLPGDEGTFLLCSFWLADNYSLIGREDEAVALFNRLLALRNDVGLLSEQYDTIGKRLLGNFPQAFSHVGIVNTAFNLTRSARHPALEREES